MRLANIPFVLVDEAKRAVVGNTKLKTFDYVVYTQSGNWLVLCCGERWPCPADRADLEQWGRIFGDGFEPVIVRDEREGLIVYPLHNSERLLLSVALDAGPDVEPGDVEALELALEPATLPDGQTVFDAHMCPSGTQLALPFGGVPCLR